MKTTRLLRATAIVGLTGLLVGPAAKAEELPRVDWKVASSYTTSLDILGPNGPRVLKNIETMSGGNFKLKFFEPGALVPALEVFNTVSKGAVEASYTTSGFHTGIVPAFAFFSSVPFGPQVDEYLAWINEGGGGEIYRELYAEHDVIGFHCGSVVAEASGWFREEITSVDQLKGMKMRFFGLGALVMNKLGVSTQLIAPADIYAALERGVIDATELSFPSIDLNFGYYQIAKHYYFPGWHQQASLVELIVNLPKYNELPEAYQLMLEVACNDAVVRTLAEGGAKQVPAIEELKGHGVIFHRWSDEDLATLREAWAEVMVEKSAEDPVFKRVADSYLAFRENYTTWRELNFMP